MDVHGLLMALLVVALLVVSLLVVSLLVVSLLIVALLIVSLLIVVARILLLLIVLLLLLRWVATLLSFILMSRGRWGVGGTGILTLFPGSSAVVIISRHYGCECGCF